MRRCVRRCGRRVLPTSSRVIRHCATTPNASEAHFVFIEGGAGVGKSSICDELHKRGYVVHFENFVRLCNENSLYSPSGSVMSIKWVSHILTALERHTREWKSMCEQSPTTPASQHTCDRARLLFFDRSFLTPYIYTRGTLNNLYVLDAMKEVKRTFQCTTVLCGAEPSVIKQRLLDRYEAGTPEEQRIRRNLGELNEQYIAGINSRYKKLEREGWFELALDTSSSNVSSVTNDLLTSLGVDVTE